MAALLSPIITFFYPVSQSDEAFSITVVSGRALACGFGSQFDPGTTHDLIEFSQKDLHRLQLTAEIVSAKLGNTPSSPNPVID
jgi:hypothetical protein